MATASKAVKRGFAVRCIHCGEEGTVRVDVADVSLVCVGCDEMITRAEVEAMVGEWTRLLAWLDMAPERE